MIRGAHVWHDKIEDGFIIIGKCLVDPGIFKTQELGGGVGGGWNLRGSGFRRICAGWYCRFLKGLVWLCQQALVYRWQPKGMGYAPVGWDWHRLEQVE